MYKLILVDDESEIRHGLMEVIPFGDLGFTVAGEASNGLEALALLEEQHPDLILTDIRMPIMDGLAFCRRARDILPTARFIILTGYDDYEYVRQAIEMKTMSYLLKPISADEFCEVLRETKTKLDKEFAERNDLIKLREHLNMSFPLLKESLLASVFTGAIGSARALEAAARYELPLASAAYLPALCRVGGQEGGERIQDLDLLTFSVIDILKETLCTRYTAHVFHYNGMIALLLPLESPDQAASALALIKEAREVVIYYLKCELNIGVGAAVTGMDKLPGAVNRALTALEQSVITPDSAVMSIDDIQYGLSMDISCDEARLRKLSNLIRLAEGAGALALLKELLAVCREAMPGVKAYQAYLMEILLTFVRIVPEISPERVDFSEAFSRFSRTVFLNCPAFDEAERLLSAILADLLDAVLTGRRNARRFISRQAEEYMQMRFGDEDLSLETLCRHLHVSPSYFSAVFKKEKQVTFHQYLTALRMDRALELLTSTDMKTARVAAAVGIPDPSYFSYCFKKHFGYSPSGLRRGKEQANA
ncbi:MAG: response regulator [Clostridia bacterium]|nr:response regulator [Clostridia bacterium]